MHVALALGLVLAAAPVAPTASTPGALELYPTFRCIGLRLAYRGDADANAVAHLAWRRAGEAKWHRGVDLSRIANSRWAGSVIGLDADTRYEVRGVIEDPDGGGGAVTRTVRTRRRLPDTPTGRTWVVAPHGNDEAAGTTQAPFRTLAHAASLVRPGDAIRVKPGVYHESFDTPRSGTATQPIHLIAEPGAILDGSDPAYLHRTDWRSEGGGIWSVPYTGTTRLVCADSMQRVYRQGTLERLRLNHAGVAQGWAAENGRLYVKLEDRSNPAGHTMHVADLDTGLFLDESFWRVSGFTVRFFGTTVAASGITLKGGTGCEVLDHFVFACAGRFIFLRVGASDALVAGNRCVDPRIASWPWYAVKGHYEEISAILDRGGRGNVIAENFVSGMFDGVTGGGGDRSNENEGADADYLDNVCERLGDDGIETDDYAAINVRVIGNAVFDALHAVSVAPIMQGPYYCLRNLFANARKGGLKLSLGGRGAAWVVHNTFTGPAPALHATGHYANVHLRNNVLGGDPPVDDGPKGSEGACDFDGDLLFTHEAVVFRWKGTDYATLDQLRGATGFERNGRAGDPLFLHAAARDCTLPPGSPAVDAGLFLPGLNDRFRGAAPDVGAFELGDVAGRAGAPSARDSRAPR